MEKGFVWDKRGPMHFNLQDMYNVEAAHPQNQDETPISVDSFSELGRDADDDIDDGNPSVAPFLFEANGKNEDDSHL
jgi:hypothetical protein